jgi:hypothetical protein
VTGSADRSQQAEPSEPTATERTFLYQFAGPAEAPDTWTADAAYPADSPDSPDSPVPYTLTANAETLLDGTGSPTPPSPNAHARGMGTRPRQPRSGLSGPARTYITEISVPPSDSGIHRLHARMKDPEPKPEAGL